MILPVGFTRGIWGFPIPPRVAPENACDAFSGATRVEPDGNHITAVAYVAMITVHNECCIGFFFLIFGVKFGKLRHRSAMAI